MQFARAKNKKKQTNSVPKSLPFGTGFFLASKDHIDLQSIVFLCRKYFTAVRPKGDLFAPAREHTVGL